MDPTERASPEMLTAIESIRTVVPAPPPDPGVEFRRQALDAVYGRLAGPTNIHAHDDSALGPRGPVPVRVYDTGPSDTVLVWFHGGAWVAGGIESHDGICRTLCERSGAVVVSVDYRLAPEHPFPTGLEDARAALNWAWDHRDTLGVEGDRVVVAGDSAGGTFAAVLAIEAAGGDGPPVAGQVLVYPSTDLTMSSDSWNEFGGGPHAVGRAEVERSLECYQPPRDDWRASPLLADDLVNAGPALIITAELDPLRDEGEAFGRRLVESGVPTTLHRVLGVIHGFVGLPDLASSDAALAEIAHFIRRKA